MRHPEINLFRRRQKRNTVSAAGPITRQSPSRMSLEYSQGRGAGQSTKAHFACDFCHNMPPGVRVYSTFWGFGRKNVYRSGCRARRRDPERDSLLPTLSFSAFYACSAVKRFFLKFEMCPGPKGGIHVPILLRHEDAHRARHDVRGNGGTSFQQLAVARNGLGCVGLEAHLLGLPLL
jgi:hypothetical protein